MRFKFKPSAVSLRDEKTGATGEFTAAQIEILVAMRACIDAVSKQTWHCIQCARCGSLLTHADIATASANHGVQKCCLLDPSSDVQREIGFVLFEPALNTVAIYVYGRTLRLTLPGTPDQQLCHLVDLVEITPVMQQITEAVERPLELLPVNLEGAQLLFASARDLPLDAYFSPSIVVRLLRVLVMAEAHGSLQIAPLRCTVTVPQRSRLTAETHTALLRLTHEFQIFQAASVAAAGGDEPDDEE